MVTLRVLAGYLVRCSSMVVRASRRLAWRYTHDLADLNDAITHYRTALACPDSDPDLAVWFS